MRWECPVVVNLYSISLLQSLLYFCITCIFDLLVICLYLIELPLGYMYIDVQPEIKTVQKEIVVCSLDSCKQWSLCVDLGIQTTVLVKNAWSSSIAQDSWFCYHCFLAVILSPICLSLTGLLSDILHLALLWYSSPGGIKQAARISGCTLPRGCHVEW